MDAIKSFGKIPSILNSSGSRSTARSRYDGIEHMLDRLEAYSAFFIYSGAAISFALALSQAVTTGAAAGFRMLSVTAAVSLAAASVGGALGFLFGIPRVLQNAGAARKGAASAASAPAAGKEASEGSPAGSFFSTNTSLEEISDWLTKIIIGVSLTQFENILEHVNKASIYTASFVSSTAIGSSPAASGLSACFFAVIVASMFLSCLYFYLQTRTRITILFQEMEAHIRLGISPDLINDVLTSPISTESTTPASKGVPQANPLTDSDLMILKTDRSELKSSKEIAAWAAALARNNDLQGAESALLNAVQLEPDNIDILMRLAEVRRLNNASGFVDTVANLVRKAKDRPDVVDMGRQGQLEALYLNPPRGFRKAIEISDLLVGSALEQDPYFHLRRACAYGQMYSFEKRTSSAENPDLLNLAREEALKSLRMVVELSPDISSPVRAELRRLLVDDETVDDDFRDLRDLPEFKDFAA